MSGAKKAGEQAGANGAEGSKENITGEMVQASAQTAGADGSSSVDEKTSPEGAPTTDANEETEARPWRRFAFGGPRTSPGALVVGVLALGLGFAAMTQVRQHEKSGLDNLSQPELVALLSTVNDQSARLGAELDDLRQSKEKLARGGDSAAVADAQKRLDQLAVLNGTAKVRGPGITIHVSASHGRVNAANVLDAVQELRDAGAEAIDVGGHRVIASTWFDDGGGSPRVEGQALPDGFDIVAIGDSHTMSTAMAIPGGVTDTLTQAGAQVKVVEGSSLDITSVRPSS